MIKKELPLLEELLKYHKENNLILSMPGNKCGKGFLRDDIGRKFVNNLGFLDITEVEPLDNLHCPEGIIKEAQDLLSKTYGVKKAYFMVNGSSGGNLVSIFSAFIEGDEVLVERNCHKSIYNGLILRKLKVTYIEPIIDKKNGIFLPPNEENIYKALKKADNPKGIILTYPNYFGICYDVENVIKDLKGKGMKIIIDGAHGAHFGVNEKLPKSIVALGDYVVLSAHKTLPALTQGSYLLVNEYNNNIEFYISAFMTTSPSYLIMASLDYGRYYLDKYADQDYEKLIILAEEWKKKINTINKVHILNKDDLEDGYDLDLSRYLIVLKDGYSGHKLLDYLRTKKIQAEMSFSSGVVLILSPFNAEKDFEYIYNSINELDLNSLKENSNIEYYNVIPSKVMEPYEVFESEWKFVDIEQCEGEISKDAIVPYPPGIPLICAGEIISKEIVEIINNYIENNKTVIGVVNKRLKILDV
ncbi:decarboxylase [Clostridium gasigenes]|nr:decarboxylase [Clostridium gasigenes]MBU3103729.1 decarboxylase [Clostridium gasigenes]